METYLLMPIYIAVRSLILAGKSGIYRIRASKPSATKTIMFIAPCSRTFTVSNFFQFEDFFKEINAVDFLKSWIQYPHL
jgi:hypothetical protein